MRGNKKEQNQRKSRGTPRRKSTVRDRVGERKKGKTRRIEARAVGSRK